jgi:hypothetical protein
MREKSHAQALVLTFPPAQRAANQSPLLPRGGWEGSETVQSIQTSVATRPYGVLRLAAALKRQRGNRDNDVQVTGMGTALPINAPHKRTIA